MQQITDIIRTVTEAPFGFCPFESVADKLLDCRAKSRLPQNAKTIIMFAFPYKVYDEKTKNISRYAAVPDYHNVCGKILTDIAEKLKEEYNSFGFEAFIDNSPIPEVYAAASAGLGVCGRNGLLITKEYGSFVFLGEIVTDMEMNAEIAPFRDCSLCGACERACPVGLQKNGCLSAVTQQKKELSKEQSALICENGSVWGCDICQNVCPMNANTDKTFIDEFKNGYRDCYQKGEDIENRAYAWRGEKVIMRNAELFD